jgi:antitoxin CptB
MNMPETAPEDNISIKRKQLLFRSWHRGTREIDLMLGKFADSHVPGFDEAQLALYDRFLNNSDPDIYNWLTGQEPLPPAEDTVVTRLLLDFYKQK